MNDSYKNGYWGQESENILERQFPLHHACRDGDSSLLSTLLIKAQHSIYEEDSFYGWTPIHWASYFGKLNCLMLLSEKGVSCDLVCSRLRQTLCHLAALSGHCYCVKWLLHLGASLEKKDYLGETALHKAARTGSLECCTLLVTNGAKTDLTNNNGQTAAQLASSFGHTQCVRLFESASLQHSSNTTHVASFTQELTHANSLYQLPPSSVHQNGCGDLSCAPQFNDGSDDMEISESVNGAAGDAGITLQHSSVRSPKDITSSFNGNPIVAGKKRPAIDLEYLGNKRQCLLQESNTDRFRKIEVSPKARASSNSVMEHASLLCHQWGYDSMLHDMFL